MATKFFGKMNLDDGMFSTEGMRPIGAGLHDPPIIC